MTKKQRNLDGIYFRVERDGKWGNVCYSDMTKEERDKIEAIRAERVTPEEQATWYRALSDMLADTLYDMAEQFDIVCE